MMGKGKITLTEDIRKDRLEEAEALWVKTLGWEKAGLVWELENTHITPHLEAFAMKPV